MIFLLRTLGLAYITVLLHQSFYTARRRITWDFFRISKQRRNIVRSITFEDKKLFDLVKQVIAEADSDESFLHDRIDT